MADNDVADLMDEAGEEEEEEEEEEDLFMCDESDFEVQQELSVGNTSESKDLNLVIHSIIDAYGEDCPNRLSRSLSPLHNLYAILELATRKCDDFVSIRQNIVDSGIITVVLDCLKAAKQVEKDQHIVALLQILASFISPHDAILSRAEMKVSLPKLFNVLLVDLDLLSIVRSFLKVDSIQPLIDRVDVHRSILLLIRAISATRQTVHMLHMTFNGDEETSLCNLLYHLEAFTQKNVAQLDNELVQDIQLTTLLVRSAVRGSDWVGQHLEKTYVEVMTRPMAKSNL